jgi:hypothetical protein
MNLEAEEGQLRLANEHLAKAALRIRDLGERIQAMDGDAPDTVIAVALLRTMRETLWLMQHHKGQILEAIERIKREQFLA